MAEWAGEGCGRVGRRGVWLSGQERGVAEWGAKETQYSCVHTRGFWLQTEFQSTNGYGLSQSGLYTIQVGGAHTVQR